MNAKTWAPLAAAIVMGAVAAKVGHNMLSRKPAEKTVVQHVARVVIAKEDIVPGAAIKPTDVAISTVAENTVMAGSFRGTEDVVGRVATVSVLKGQAICENFLAPRGSSKGLTAIVPDGMRAVTLEVTEVSGVAGLLVPGCRVDMVNTFTGTDGQLVSRTVARDLQVLAVGRRFGDAGKEDAPEAPAARNVTLLVTPRQAQVIDLAAHGGMPRLVLRGSRDSHHDGSDDGVTLAELSGVDGGWFKGMGSWFGPLARAMAMPQPRKTLAGGPTTEPTFGNPTTRPGRVVTVIRNTREQTVTQVEAQPEPKQPAIAETKDPADRQ